MIIGLTPKDSPTSLNHVALIVLIIDKISTEISKIPLQDFSTIIDPTFQSTNYYKQKGPAASHSLPHGTKNYLDFSQPFIIAIKN